MPNIEAGAWFLVARAARPVILEVECRDRAIDRFVREYNEWAGGNLTWRELAAEGHAMDMAGGKWGVEARIYIPNDDVIRNQMRRYGFRPEQGGVRHRNTLRINNGALFQELVSAHGLRLGYND